jgi:hypothetical protein
MLDFQSVIGRTVNEEGKGGKLRNPIGFIKLKL